MNAIKTEYRGLTFRSRLEARWYVAFCGMGIDTVFEPEGYEYPDGRYLPDFATVADNALFSIKPLYDRANNTRAWLRELEWQRVLIAHGLPLWIIAGVPAPGQYAAFSPDGELTEYVFTDCRRCDGVCLCSGIAWHQIGKHACNDHDREPCDSARVLNAMRTAMAETFGERNYKPQPR